MENKQTAMQIMLNDLKLKQSIYEDSGCFECATSLVTSIDLAERLMSMEKEQIKDAWKDSNYHRFSENVLEYSSNEYYEETYGK